jgi:transcriptional regulator with XRE-family HTH domain
MKTIQGKSLSALRKKFRFLRQLSGLTLQELSSSSGVSASQLCEFESGVAGMRPPSCVRLRKFYAAQSEPAPGGSVR